MAFLDETGLAKVRDWIKGKFVQTVNGQAIDSKGNVVINVGVTSVNGTNADANGNVNVELPCYNASDTDYVNIKRDNWNVGYYLPTNDTDKWINIMDFNNLVNKPDKAEASIIETWNDGTNWYRKYSDGFIEQGGTASTGERGTYTVTLNIAFKNNTSYNVVTVAINTSAEYNSATVVGTKTTTTFQISCFYARGGKHDWYACGY